MLASSTSASAEARGTQRPALALRTVAPALGLIASRRAALVLMALFLGALALQALLPQRGTVSELQYTLWRSRYPTVARASEALGLDRVASTPWFWALGSAIALSLTACTMRRASTFLRRGPPPRGREAYLNLAPPPVGTSPAGQPPAGQPPAGLMDIAASLRRHGYLVKLGQDGLSARTGSLGPWGSVVFHGGMVVLFLGVLVSAATRFTGFVELAPGQIFQEHSGYLVQRAGAWAHQEPDFSIGVTGIGVAFWPDRSIQDIWAEVALQGTEGIVAQGVVRRNQSLHLQGSSLTLGSPFGPAAQLSFRLEDGHKESRGYVNFPVDNSGSRSQFKVPDTVVTVHAELVGGWREFLENRYSADQPRLKFVTSDSHGAATEYDLPLGEAVTIADGELRFEALETWALFMVSRDQGLPMIIAGAVLAFAGLAAALFIIPRWITVTSLPGGGWRVMYRTPWGTGSLLRELRELTGTDTEGT